MTASGSGYYEAPPKPGQSSGGDFSGWGDMFGGGSKEASKGAPAGGQKHNPAP